MSHHEGEPEGIVLVFRRLDDAMGELRADMKDVNHRLTALQIQVSQLSSTESSHYASTPSGSTALRTG